MINLSVNKKYFTFLSKGWLQKIADEFSREERISEQKDVSLIFVDNEKIKKLNKDYRGRDEITDVLSFSNNNDDFDRKEDGGYLGEIFICIPRAKKQAKLNHNSFKNEIAWLLIHGLAHLTGYDHEDGSTVMYELENRVLSRLGLPVNEFNK